MYTESLGLYCPGSAPGRWWPLAAWVESVKGSLAKWAVWSQGSRQGVCSLLEGVDFLMKDKIKVVEEKQTWGRRESTKL